MQSFKRQGVVLGLLAGVLLLLVSVLTRAATLDILVDRDNNTATGCVVGTPTGTLPGFEQVFRTTVDTAVFPPQVTGITSSECTGALFGAPVSLDTASWPLGIGTGTSGYDVVETYFTIPTTFGQYRLGFVYTDPNSGTDVLLTTDGQAGGGAIILDLGPLPMIPTLAHGALLLLAFALGWLALRRLRQHKVSTLVMGGVMATIVAGTALAAVILDGLINDWAGVPPIATDPLGDAPTGADLAAAFVQREGLKVFTRVDVKTANALAFTSAPATTFIVGTPGSFAITTSAIPPVTSITQTGALPAGVTFSHTAGQSAATLSGTPAAGTGGVYPLTFTASNGTPQTGTQSFTLTINQAPAITSANNATFIVGTPGTFTFTTTGFPNATLTLTGCTPALPAGLTFTANANGTATLAGSAALGSVGTYNCTLSASNGVGAPVTQPFALTINQAPTTTAVTASPNPSIVGQQVTFTATVTATAPGTGTPTGTVTFSIDGNPQAPITLNASGVATLSTTSLTLGAHAISTTYNGDANFLTSTGNLPTQNVSNAGSTSTVVSSANPSVFGQAVTFTATVAAAPPASGTPTGTVQFMDGATPLGAPVTLAAGSASLTTSALATGSHTITAVYSGDANFGGSTSPTLTQVVNAASTTTTLGSAPNPSAFGETVTLTATVAAVAPGAGTPTGTVQFFDGATPIGAAVALAGGVATTTTSALAAGPHSLTAQYSGATSFSASTSNAVTHTVTQASTTTALTSSSNPSQLGSPVTFSAAVSAVAPGAGVPSGTVNFFDGATPLGSGTLAAGVAQFTTSSLTTGSHTITATYAGDANFLTSTSAPLTQTVNNLPVAVADSHTTVHDTPLTVAAPGVLSNDTGTPPPVVNGVAGSGACTLATACATTAGGSVTLQADGSFSYTPPPTFAGPDTFTYTVNNSSGTSAPGTVTITVTDAPPVIDLNGPPAGIDFGPATYTEGDPPLAIVDPAQLTITDADSTTIASATVSITNLTDIGAEILGWTCPLVAPDCTTGVLAADVVYDPNTGVLTITGDDTLANYQTLLRTITYQNTSQNPTATPTRDITFAINDQIVDNNPLAHATVTIVAVNDAPTIAGPTTINGQLSVAYAFTGADTVSIADVDAGTGALQVTLTGTNGTISGLGSTAGLTVSGSLPAATVSLTGPLTNLNTALAGLTFTPSSTSGVTLQIDVNDQGNTGTGGPLTATKTITVNFDARPFVVSTVPIGNATGVPPNQVIQVNFNETVTVTAASFTLNCGSSVSFTLGGSAAAYTLTPSTPLPVGATCTLTVVAANVTDSASQTMAADFVITFTVNQAPVITTSAGATTFTEGAGPVAIDSGLTVTDADSANLTGGTVQITTACASGEDVLGFTTQNGISGTYSAATCLLTLTGTSSVANYQTALRSITYSNSSQSPSTTARVVSFIVSDASVNSNIATKSITVVAVNSAPVLANGSTLSYTENNPATAINTAITVSDVDSTNLTGATVSITGNLASGEDVLGFANTATITASYNAGTGVLTLSGTDTLANYQAALRSVTYSNSSDNPSTLARTVSYQVNDGAAANNLSNIVTSTINVTAVNDAPVLANGSTLAYTENDAAAVINGAITVTDVDSTNLTGATISITANFSSGQDVLSFVNTATITGVYNAGTGVLTLTGSDTLANYQTALRSVRYNNSSENPSTLARTVSFQVNDGSAANNLSNIVTSTINITAVNDAPVLANGGPGLTYTENGAAAIINAAITVTDPDSTNLTGATISITGNFASGQDVLSFANTATITGAYNAGTGVLTLSGTDTLANYQAALRNVRYSNSSDNPSTAARTVSFQANDGAAANNLSNIITSSITVIAVNDAPTANAFANLPAQAGIPITYPAGKLGGTDPEGTTITVVATPDSLCAGCLLTINANGDGGFTFTPPPLAAGTTVSFTYHVSDNGNPLPAASSAPATVSFAVAGPAIFFVKNPAVGAGNCTLGNECLFATAITNIGAATNAGIFIGDANSHTAAAGTTLNSGGRVIGQGMTAGFDAFFGIGAPAEGTLAVRPATNLPRPTLTTASGPTLALGLNNTLRGFNIGIAGTPAPGGLAGTNYGTLTLSEFAITTSGAALNLNNGVGTPTFDSITSTGGANNIVLTAIGGTADLGSGALSGATARAIDIDGGTGTISYAGTISNGGSGLRVINKPGGTVTFSGASKTLNTGANAAVTLTNNTGATINFTTGGLVITTSSGIGFNATGGGTISVQGTGNSISSSSATAVNVVGTTIGAGGMTFQSISSGNTTAAADPANGIVLNGTGSGGFFTVTGDGSQTGEFFDRDGSGGTITNTTGDAVLLTNAFNVTLRQMNINNAGWDGVQSTGGGGIVLSAVDINTPGQANPPSNGSTGNPAGFGGGNGWYASNITGVNAVNHNSRVINWQSSQSNAVLLHNIDTNFTSFTFDKSLLSTSATGAAGFHANLNGATTGQVSVTNSEFTLIDQNAVQILNNGSGATRAIVQANNFHDSDATDGDGNNTLFLALAGSGDMNFTIGGATAALGNTFTNTARLSALAGIVQVNAAGGLPPSGSAGAQLNGTIQNNTITNPGFVSGRRGIMIAAEASAGSHGGHIVSIANNSVQNLNGIGIYASLTSVGGAYDLLNNHFSILNNQVGNIAAVGQGGGDSGSAIEFETNIATDGSGADIVANVLIQGNTAVSNNNSGIGDTIEIANRSGNATGAGNTSTLNLTILGNNLTQLNAGGDVFQISNSVMTTTTVNVDLNSDNIAANRNTFTGGDADGVLLRNDAGTFRIENLVGGAEAFVEARNTGNVTVTGVPIVATGAVPLPTNPSF